MSTRPKPRSAPPAPETRLSGTGRMPSARSPEWRATLPSRTRINARRPGRLVPRQPQGRLHCCLRVQRLDPETAGVAGGRGPAQEQPQPELDPVGVREGGHRGHAVGAPGQGHEQRAREHAQGVAPPAGRGDRAGIPDGRRRHAGCPAVRGVEHAIMYAMGVAVGTVRITSPHRMRGGPSFDCFRQPETDHRLD